MPRLLKITDVMERVGLSRPALYALMQKGLFPRPLKVGPKAVRWPESEIDDWVASRPRAEYAEIIAA